MRSPAPAYRVSEASRDSTVDCTFGFAQPFTRTAGFNRIDASPPRSSCAPQRQPFIETKILGRGACRLSRRLTEPVPPCPATETASGLNATLTAGPESRPKKVGASQEPGRSSFTPPRRLRHGGATACRLRRPSRSGLRIGDRLSGVALSGVALSGTAQLTWGVSEKTHYSAAAWAKQEHSRNEKRQGSREDP